MTTSSIATELLVHRLINYYIIFFFNDTAPTEIYTLSLHDALPISRPLESKISILGRSDFNLRRRSSTRSRDRKSTRLNSSHQIISYAVFCLKKKTNSKSSPNSRSQLEN